MWMLIRLSGQLQRLNMQLSKRIRQIISDSSYRVAQECSVIVAYPKMRIEGSEVVLGEAHIMLPDCRIVDIKQLEDIEKGRKEAPK